MKAALRSGSTTSILHHVQYWTCYKYGKQRKCNARYWLYRWWHCQETKLDKVKQPRNWQKQEATPSDGGTKKMEAVLSEPWEWCQPTAAGITAACLSRRGGVSALPAATNADRTERYPGRTLPPNLRLCLLLPKPRRKVRWEPEQCSLLGSTFLRPRAELREGEEWTQEHRNGEPGWVFSCPVGQAVLTTGGSGERGREKSGGRGDITNAQAQGS